MDTLQLFELLSFVQLPQILDLLSFVQLPPLVGPLPYVQLPQLVSALFSFFFVVLSQHILYTFDGVQTFVLNEEDHGNDQSNDIGCSK